MLCSHVAHERHQNHVVIDSQVALLVDGSQLELSRSHLVVACLDGDAQFYGTDFQILHELHDTLGDATEIVVFQLLVLGSLMSHERTACEQQVWSCPCDTLIYQEILLFDAQEGLDFLHLGVEVVAYIHRSLIYSTQCAEQGSLVVERLTRVGDEDGGDAKCVIHDEDG